MHHTLIILLATMIWLSSSPAEAQHIAPGLDVCDYPELLLTKVPVQDIEKLYKKRCKRELFAPITLKHSCRYKNYTRNAIFAAYGKKFRTKAWREHFKKAKWYRPSESFSDDKMSRIAWKNIKKLKKGCVETKQFKQDKRLAQRWVKSLQTKNLSRTNRITTFPHYIFDEVGNKKCKVIKKNQKNLFKCLHGYRNYSSVKPGWESSLDTVYSRDAWLFDSDGLPAALAAKLKTSRILTINFAPADIECMTLKPGDRSAYECGAFGTTIAVAIYNGKIIASGWHGGSACPFVYTNVGGKLRREGEILRNLSSPQLYARQRLPIKHFTKDKTLRVTLAEEKQEASFIDEVFLLVDGKRVAPTECEAKRADCTLDRQFLILRQGDSQTYTFDIPTTAKIIELVATGYYLHAPSHRNKW